MTCADTCMDWMSYVCHVTMPQLELISLRPSPRHLNWLVVSPYPSEKYGSIGMIVPNIWKNNHIPNHQDLKDPFVLFPASIP